MTEPKLINPLWDQGWRRRTSLSMMYASPEAKAPLVMTLSGYPDTPDILEMVSDDGTKREYAIVDRERFERLVALATKAHGLWRGQGYAIDEFWEQMSRMQDSDRDPLP